MAIKIQKWITGAGILLLAAQVFQPDRTNPPIDRSLTFESVVNPPAELTSLLKNACYDCHSHETKYPWYAYFSPVSWYLDNHIKEGRDELNFSIWASYDAADMPKIYKHVAEEVEESKMPLSSYTWLHPEARISAAQRDLIVKWFAANRPQ